MSSSTKKTLTTPKGFMGDWDTALLWLYKVDAYFEANATTYADDAPKIYPTLGLCEERKAVQKWAEGYSGWANLRAQDTANLAAHDAAIIAHNAAVTALTATGPYTGQAPILSDWCYDRVTPRDENNCYDRVTPRDENNHLFSKEQTRGGAKAPRESAQEQSIIKQAPSKRQNDSIPR
jgi:hypothetical protein